MALKVVTVVDKVDTAIDRLAKGNQKYLDAIDNVILDVHPKRPDPQQLARFEQEVADADIIDWQYFRTAEMLRERYDLSDKKQMLTHHNPYSITEQDWNGYDMVVANNKTIFKRLGEITESHLEYVPNCVDTEFWTFNPDWEPNHNVLMVANRIEGKKGILEVAQACRDLNLHFILVGSISDPNYFSEITRACNVEFHQQISDEALRDLYYKSTIHVCNSQDNFESGTNPILEAMLTGVPVLTREIGHVPELNNGENMYVRQGQKEDVEDLKNALLEMIGDKKRLAQMRENAWQTAKARSFERRAYMYLKLYREVMWPEQTPVSVVVPVFDKPDIIRQCLNAIAEQTYKNIEIVVCDDYGVSNSNTIEDFKKYVSIPVKYIHTGNNDYGLARARNEGTIEASGEIMVYCDQRMIMAPNAIEEFVKAMPGDKTWLYGNKGAKKEFVENFSCIKRQDIINMGLFSERITAYGGMSQECRVRFRFQGGRTEYVESAKATPAGKSSNRNRKRADIIRMKTRLWKEGLEQ